MISTILFILIGWIGLISESTWLHTLSINQILPNLSLILVVSCGILLKEEKGRRIGLLVGLIQDFLFLRILGFYGALYYLIGHFSGKISKNMSRNLLILPILLVFCSDVAFGIIQYIVFRFFTGDLYFGYSLIRQILPEAVYSSLFAILLYPLWRALSHLTRYLDENFLRLLTDSGRERS